MPDLITFTLSPEHARAVVALGVDATAPALARAACDLIWQQMSTPATTRRAPVQTLRPLPGVDYSPYDHTTPLGPRAGKLAQLLKAAGAAEPLGLARALTGRDLRHLGELTEREGLQLLHLQESRAQALARAAKTPSAPTRHAAPREWQPDPRTSIEEQGRDWLGL